MPRINWNRRNFRIAVISLIVGVIGVMVAIVQWKSASSASQRIETDDIADSMINQMNENHGIVIQKVQNLYVSSENPVFSDARALQLPLLLMPTGLAIAYTDPDNPNNPHALIEVTGVNRGTGEIVITEVAWDIHDGYGRITPPDEWRAIQSQPPLSISTLRPGDGFVYLYGPEIGSATPREYPANEKHLALKLTGSYRIQGLETEQHSTWEGFAMFDQKQQRYVFVTEHSSPEIDYGLVELMSNRIRSKVILEPGAATEGSSEQVRFRF